MNNHLSQQMAQIARAVATGQYRYTVHGAQQQIARGIHRNELEEAIASGEIIEDYPQNHYDPACLIPGWTLAGRPLHVVCSVQSIVAIITVYEPNLTEWEADLRTRRA
jgi:hypothetical protein